MQSAQSAAPTTKRNVNAAAGDVLLQAFDWGSADAGNWYGTVQGKVSSIASAGFTKVWLPPPAQSVDVQGCARIASQLSRLKLASDVT